MNTRFKPFLTALLFLVLLSSCGAPEPGSMTLTGNLSFSGDPLLSGPVFLVVSESDNFQAIEDDPINNIVTMITVDSSGEFHLNLSDLNINPGETIYVSAFADNNYENKLPYPDTGDLIGFYINEENKEPALLLQDGENNIQISLNREVFEYDASVSGSLSGPETGEVILFAYRGEISSFSTDSIDTDLIMAFEKITKDQETVSFNADIMPYGADVPIDDVYIMAVFDANGNGSPDAGDRIGFYSDAEGIPERVTILEGDNSGLDISFSTDIPVPSGYTISLEGHPAIPEGYTSDSPPLYIMVAETDNPADLLNDAVTSIRAFTKLEAGTVNFTLDLSDTALEPGDEVMVIGLWDKDNNGGFPKPTAGDLLGFYHTPNLSNFSMTVTLEEGINTIVPGDSRSFSINRPLYDFDASVAGSVTGTGSGQLLLIAYTGEITSMNAGDLDVNRIIGYHEMNRSDEDTPYSLDIMPLGFDLPIADVYCIALLDVNGNSVPDGGDRMGFHADSDGIPQRINVTEGVTTDIDIALTMDIPEPSGSSITLTGNLQAPEGYSSTSAPLYVMITNASDPSQILDDPAGGITAFQKLDPGSTDFSIDLSSTGLNAGDDIMVIALWDKDNDGGFPKPTTGDIIGFYHTSSLDDYHMEVTLTEGNNTVIESGNWVFPVNRTLYDYEAEITGTIDSEEAGTVILFAYTGEISSFDVGLLEADNVIAYSSIDKESGPQAYTLPIMAMGHNVPIENVYIMALLDVNGNGQPDGGDSLGFYTGGGDVPIPLVINEGTTSSIDINFSMAIDTPSGYSISIDGYVTPPDGYNAESPPLYIMVADSESPEALLEDPVSSIRSFQKLTPGASSFNLDLSSTSLVPGDEIMVIALWDKDSTGGFPDPTPGDIIGFYHSKSLENYSMTVTLAEGANTVIPDDDNAFGVDRTMYDYEASITGSLTDDEESAVILIAYTGELASLDPADLNIDNVIAYHTVEKSFGPQAYTLDIIPLSFDVPISDVYIIALYDRNGNGLPDAGDGMGYYSSTANGIPDSLVINEGEQTNIDLSLSRDIDTPSGFTITLSGNVDAPAGYSAASSPMYIMVASGDDPAALLSNPASSIHGFKKLDPGATDFELDLSSTSLIPGSEVMVIALWDKDNSGGFPEPTAGDMVGFYHTTSIDSFEMSLTLAEGNNNVSSDGSWLFSANHLLYEHDASVTGTISGTGSGDVLLVAYPEELTSMNVSDIDVEKILGYTTISKGAGDTSYSLDILPFDYNVPVEGLYVMALLDVNGNGIPDGGDTMGYYSSNANGIPTRITVNNGVTPNIDINLTMDIPTPSGYTMSIEGDFDRPDGYDVESAPMYIMVAKTADPMELFSNPLNVIKAFTKLDPGSTDFTIDLSSTDLVPGDEVMVIGLWDLDNDGGFPDPTPGPSHTPGDKVGFFQNSNTTAFQFGIILSDAAPNQAFHQSTGDWKFQINRDLYDYATELQFKIDITNGPDGVAAGDNFIIIAVHEDGADTSGITDVNYVLGMEIMPYVADPDHLYTLPIFTALYDGIADTSQMNINIYALYDADGDGAPSTGDNIYTYYGKIPILNIYYPKTFNLVSDMLNIISNPDHLIYIEMDY